MCLVPLSGCQPREEAPTQPQGQAAVVVSRKDTAKKLAAQSAVSLTNKDVKGAVAALEDAIKADPSDFDNYLRLSRILIKTDQFSQATELLDRAVKIFPDNGMVFYMLGVSNKMAGHKLPAALAVRRSFDIFKAANDMENTQKSDMLLKEILASPGNPASAVAQPLASPASAGPQRDGPSGGDAAAPAKK